MAVKVFPVLADRLAELVKKLDRVQRKAAEYGCKFGYEVGAEYVRNVRVIDHATGRPVPGVSIPVAAVDVSIDGAELVRRDGFEVLAQIEHLPGGNVVSMIGLATFTAGDAGGNIQAQPSRQLSESDGWRSLPARCEHCGTDRARRITFIVGASDGRRVQVGASCLHDYSGISPAWLVLADAVADLVAGEDLSGGADAERIGAARVLDVVEAVALAVRVYRLQGYIRSGEVGANKDYLRELLMERETPSEAELIEARRLVSVVLGLDADAVAAAGLDNAVALMRSGFCRWGHLGWLAYVPLAVERVEDRARRQEARRLEGSGSEHIGAVGQRLVVGIRSATIASSFQTAFGISHLVRIIDATGNVLVWFTGTEPRLDDWSAVKFTVKAHEVRDGVKQTIVTRCVKA